MPDFRISPISIVNQIKVNLQDRYASGYPILKELLQNADDAEARHFRLDGLSGWSTAAHPLLRGPGLLVVNDGFFRKEDESGIISFGESGKAADSAAIGKFGFGQKAVFHLCDAFVVYAKRESDRPFSTVVNPFLEVEVPGNVSRQWEPRGEGLDPADLELLRREVSSDFPDRHLVLWLPLRREDIKPAPGVSFSGNIPSLAATIRELNRPDDLRVLLTALRHLKTIEIRERSELRCALELDDARGRFLGPNRLSGGVRLFGGTIGAAEHGSTASFVGREAMIPDSCLTRLKRSQQWPQTISVLRPEPVPEKGEPHGAATLSRIPLRASHLAETAQLRVSWAVFLPISDAFDIIIPVGGSAGDRFHLLLHGYFFLDSGRRQIEGLDAPTEQDEPSDAASLRRAWNAELRDSVVLPLLPALLKDALDFAIVTSAELAQLVSAIARDGWFRSNRRAICREVALVRVLEISGGVVWRIVPTADALRPLPASVADAPGRIEELFSTIGSWAEASSTCLVAGESAALSAEPIRWTAKDLEAVFAGLSPRAFQSRDLARLLVDFLGATIFDEAERSSIGPHLVAALRRAITETQAFAPSELVRSILNQVPHGKLFPLPASVENRQVLRALASAPTNILLVRREWLDETRRPPQLSNADLKSLLNALEPLISGDHADQAATAALALLTQGGRNISELAGDLEFASIEVLRARDIRSHNPIALSLQTLVARSRAGLLFASSPQANSLLPLLTETLPDVAPLVVDGKTAEFLRDSSNSIIQLHSTGNESILKLVNAASCFGTTDARRRLLERLRPTDNDDRAALRRLCAGDEKAGYGGATLHVLEETLKGIERPVEAILNASENAFLITAEIADELMPRLRQHIGITALDTPRMEALLERDVDAVARIQLSPIERDAFLLTQLSDPLLRRLPIHARSDATTGNADNVFREADWPIPEALRRHVLTIQLSNNSRARERQERLIGRWSPQSQIKVALSSANPHRFRNEILEALAKLASPPDEHLLEALRVTPWLLVDEQPITPLDVLALPPAVDEVARTLLLKNGEIPPFVPVQKLRIEIREHDGFAHLREWVLPGRNFSFAALALMIEEARIAGRLGGANDYPVEDFTTLAKSSGDIGLPGWPLLAAVLTSLGDGCDDATKIVAAFTALSASDAKLAGAHLDCLAALAEEKGRKGEAAARAYRHGFSVVAGWPEDARREVFGGTRVLTDAGNWRIGSEVVQDGDGLDPRHVLARDYASVLGMRLQQHPEATNAENESPDPFIADRRRGQIRDVDLVALEARSADQQRLFLESWKGRVPSDLIIVYLGLIGRGEPFRNLANEWATDATVDVDTLWADLDYHFPKEILYPNPLAAEVDQRRFLIEPVLGERVQAIAMSGDSFDAALSGSDKGILIGNLHKTHEGIRAADGKARSLITLPIRQVDPTRYSQGEASAIFRRFVETIAADCLWLGMERQRTALQEMLDKAVKIDQSTIEETERLLRDRLPTILAELKLPTEYLSQQALRKYQAEESRLHHLSAPAQKLEELKAALWRKVSDGALAAELLSAVRSKIGDFGYSASRVLFELFQNADDAYRQHGGAATDVCFRVELFSNGSSGFRVVHWGRPINHMGRDTEEGRRLGHDRDLLNMLLMNFSEKRPGDDLTGKFGLGFKSVHVLSDSVGIASGFIALRTVGGFLPATWPEGIDAGENRKSPSGRKATVIDVPFSMTTADKGAEAIAAFRATVTWLPAFARTIRRVEIEADVPESIDSVCSPLLDKSGIYLVSVSGRKKERALRVDLSSGYSLLLRIDGAGPSAFSSDLRRLWNLAPLEEELRSGWLLNGPFAVDPGRTGLAGSIAERQEKFRTLGRTLGDRLLELHDLVGADWSQFARRLDLDASQQTARNIFWSRLFDVLALDFDDDLARHLHVDGHGYARLASRHKVVPTRLQSPFDSLVQASEVEHYLDGALSHSATLAKLRDWPTLTELQNRIISSEVAGQLRKLGFGTARPLHFSSLLHRQIGKEKRINPELAQTLGRAVTPQSIREAPLYKELHEILDTARHALFLAQDGTWRFAQLPYPDSAGDGEERRLCAFAPAKHLLDKRYTGPALEFFRVARERSGFGPQARDLASWAAEVSADDPNRQIAALRYIIEGRQGRDLGEEIRRNRPSWLPWPASQLRISPLLSGWMEKEKDDLLYALQGRDAFIPMPVTSPPTPAPETVLVAIHTWWSSEGTNLRTVYSQRTYPGAFSPSQLRETSDRATWFTMFALSCFQSFGRAQDGQHRSFIESGYREGWWVELADSRPPDDVRSWLDRLERWSAPEQFDQRYLPWRRSFVDLYAIARWLDEYREIALKLPRIIEEHGVISLNGALQPSYWAPAMRLCIDAAPINRSLGIGMNWMIREMLRHKVYELRDESRMAPYGWASSQRVRALLNELGADVGERADKEASRTIYDFVTKHLAASRARFEGDFDLPLQLITREENKTALVQCFETIDRDLPAFLEQWQDSEDAL
ncbi:hypothetical protein AYJ54_06095 [Bradyrhizobium centrolobii]|uniref:Sacsin/Nov domain-containing protein n=1 Tax=Bradyrhizobium centrolobii TaxID=1505087 RepID=A0A176YYV5_9BRAD|nr:hypothetical protein [Bradyrhizobium centrolobii]OAF12399.1 hypothetical protein AYJ54_06095 [Bradyrhizobium centrolobii]